MAEQVAAVGQAKIAMWDPIAEIISTSKDIEEMYAALHHVMDKLSAIREDIHKLRRHSINMPSRSYNEWIRRVTKTAEEVEQLSGRYNKLNDRSTLFFALQRTNIRKEMKRKAVKILQLLEETRFLEEGKQLQIFIDPPEQPVIKLRAPDITKFPTLQASLKQTLKFLEDDKVTGISILGTVGIGKSSILRNLNNHGQVAKMFDIVLWINASTEEGEENLSIEQLQKAIGERLRVDMTGSNNFDSNSKAISKGLDGKKYLLLLDDVKDDLDIYRTGVPDCNNGSKIVLTTNWRHVCPKIVDQEVKVAYLSDHESRMIFQDIVNRPDLKDGPSGDQALVYKIVSECGGHPLLIRAMASVFRTKDNVNFWTEGFNSLKRLSEKENHGVKYLHRVIKFCFGDLGESQRKCFLYAALYPEGSPIYIDSLLECWEAEGILGNISGHQVLEHLKNKLLLEEGDGQKFVTMPKCIRQVALYVASNDPECKPLVSNMWKFPATSRAHPYASSEDNPSSSRKESIHEYPERQLQEEHSNLEDLGLVESHKEANIHEYPEHQVEQKHINLEDIAAALDYNYENEGCSTEFSGLYRKEESTTDTTPEEGRTEQELEGVPSIPEMDLIETIASKAFCIHTLDLSYTNIRSLPNVISKFVALRVFNLRGCQLLMELVPEIGELVNLEELDLEGTEIICLPKEIAKLINLRSLKFSLSGYADQFQETKKIGSVIPRKALSHLLKLNELCIDVNPDGDWWNTEVKSVIDDLCCLQELKTLRLSVPTVDLLDNLVQHFMPLIYGTTPRFRFNLLDNLVRHFMPVVPGTSPRFRFTVGHHEERLVSRLPQEVGKEFCDLEKFDKGLKYINSESIPREIKRALKHVDAFLLERHWSINNLLEFGLENIDELRLCILLECNELQTAIDAKQSKDFDQTILGSLENLSIYYMKNMKKIWRGPVTKGSLSNLKSLALHTCISLTAIFTLGMLANLVNLEDLTIEDCPKIKTLVSLKSPSLVSRHFLPNLKKILLLELPNLRCISSGLSIAPKLERLMIFYCPKLNKLSSTEISSRDLKVIKGDEVWWDALEWHESDMTEDEQNYFTSKFVPLREDGDLEEQFFRD